MNVSPVLVACHTVDWIRVAIESYLHHCGEERLVVVDNNPRRGEPGWQPSCDRERRWLAAHPWVVLVENHNPVDGPDALRTHGSGMDAALEWCRARGVDVMLHLEPDCLIEGRPWRDELLGAISEGAWVAGVFRKSYGPIQPAPSAWRVGEVRASFKAQPRGGVADEPRVRALVDLDRLKAETAPLGSWPWWEANWDTAEKAWFEAAAVGRAVVVETSGIRHYWLGSTAHRLPQQALVGKFPELTPWFERAESRLSSRPVEHCAYRRNARAQGSTEIACCTLLKRGTGVGDEELCAVRREVCEACCAAIPPSFAEINPVIASLLFQLTGTIVERGGVEGCDVEKANQMHRWALENLNDSTHGEQPPAPPRPADGPCHYLGRELGVRIQPTASAHARLPAFECLHPDHTETTMAECQSCRDWSDAPSPAPRPMTELLPPPARRQGKPIRKWAVAVTTAPRRQPTLPWCLDSLMRAGWDRPRLFIDSGVTIPERFDHLPLTFRETKLGAWPNYYLALAELLMREPDADAFLILQDDALLHHRHPVREYLEQALWPVDPIGAVSLYCSKAYTRAAAGWHALEGEWIWGALAFIFSGASARRFLADPAVLEHRTHPEEGLANVDGVIGRWAVRHQLPIYYPTPSLVQHIGEVSSLWPTARALGYRRADRFAGDMLQFPPDPAPEA